MGFFSFFLRLHVLVFTNLSARHLPLSMRSLSRLVASSFLSACRWQYFATFSTLPGPADNSNQSKSTIFNLLRFRPSLTIHGKVRSRSVFEIRRGFFWGADEPRGTRCLNCSFVQSKCVTCSSSSCANLPLRISVQCLSFSTVSPSGGGPAMAMTLCLNFWEAMFGLIDRP